eukprot:GEMP01075076.1.p1 GENE.GEMP01075076.1~~GEMP01075076.1.p1  ORF type:complete len:206 (+),score=57.41 GEMP01075076.1:133-750(+)
MLYALSKLDLAQRGTTNELATAVLDALDNAEIDGRALDSLAEVLEGMLAQHSWGEDREIAVAVTRVVNQTRHERLAQMKKTRERSAYEQEGTKCIETGTYGPISDEEEKQEKQDGTTSNEDEDEEEEYVSDPRRPFALGHCLPMHVVVKIINFLPMDELTPPASACKALCISINLHLQYVYFILRLIRLIVYGPEVRRGAQILHH